MKSVDQNTKNTMAEFNNFIIDGLFNEKKNEQMIKNKSTIIRQKNNELFLSTPLIREESTLLNMLSTPQKNLSF
jgi:hypothetical protein